MGLVVVAVAVVGIVVVGMDRLADDDKESLYMCVTRWRSAQLYLHNSTKWKRNRGESTVGCKIHYSIYTSYDVL